MSLGDREDHAEIALVLPVTLSGGFGTDTLTSGDGADLVTGDDGNDRSWPAPATIRRAGATATTVSLAGRETTFSRRGWAWTGWRATTETTAFARGTASPTA